MNKDLGEAGGVFCWARPVVYAALNERILWCSMPTIWVWSSSPSRRQKSKTKRMSAWVGCVMAKNYPI